MQFEHLVDPVSALIVVGGTLLATVLRCGVTDVGAVARALGALPRRRFDPEQARAELAGAVRAVQRDGLIRTEHLHMGDAELDAATDALIEKRSVDALHEAYLSHKRRRAEQNVRAVRTLMQAADLSPVFGMTGTLISLSQMPPGGSAGGDFTGAISMAVLTTLYGLLLGNLVLSPLSRMVARSAAREESDRQAVLDWLEEQICSAVPSDRTTGRIVGVAQDRRP